MEQHMQNKVRFTVGTDVGGTFTDIWVVSTGGRSLVVKTPTTEDILSGIKNGLKQAAHGFDLSFTAFCNRINRFGHGTTVGLNALLTGQTDTTALITTMGFADTLEIGRLKRQFSGLNDTEVRDYYQRGHWPPLVARENVWQIPERVDRSGRVVQKLDERAVRAAAEEIAESEFASVAVCTLWSVENPVHEKRIMEMLTDILPDAYLSVSHEVAPVIGEYGRMTTTVANAILGPIMSSYFRELEVSLRDSGLSERVLAMTQAGGVVPAETLEYLPVSALFSGPAAAVIGCQTSGEILNMGNILTIDVGGTSFDVGLIVDGSPVMRSETTVAGADIQFPSVDVNSIGAGGGSIATVENGALTVGPASAGSDPGPACYGRGGSLPTATDADLILGVLNPDYFIGGQISLDVDAAEHAIREHIAEPLNVSVTEAAWGIRRILDSNMSDLLRRVTIERGHDPRDFTMIACGGSGPSHSWMLCNELGIDTFVVPPTATVHSAYGTGTSDLRRTEDKSVHIRLPEGCDATDDQVETLQEALNRVEQEIHDAFDREDVARTLNIKRMLSCRYWGQHNSLSVMYPDTEITSTSLEAFLEEFEREYESLYGQGASFRQAGYEILSVRAIGTLPLESPTPEDHGDTLELQDTRPVVFEDPESPVETAVYRTDRPAPGVGIDGPAVVEYPGHTAVVPPAATARTGDACKLHVRVQ